MRLKNSEIAKALGISSTSVSLAIHNKPGVSKDTRRKVLEMLNNSLQSEPIQDGAAFNNDPILFIIHEKYGKIIIDNKPFFSELIATAQQAAMHNSYPMQILHYLPGQNLFGFLEYISNTPASAIILLATEISDEEARHYKSIKKPIVLLDARLHTFDFNSITIDNFGSLFTAVEYAHSLGHRDIGYLRGSVPILNFQHRYDGYLHAIRYFHLENNYCPEIFLGCSMESAYADMTEYLDKQGSSLRLPSAFVSDLDYISIGAMVALKEHGYSTPEDISMIGYDDVPASEICNPPLTTVLVNRTEMGRLAVERLVQMIKNNDSFCLHTQVSTGLIVRKSTIAKA